MNYISSFILYSLVRKLAMALKVRTSSDPDVRGSIGRIFFIMLEVGMSDFHS